MVVAASFFCEPDSSIYLSALSNRLFIFLYENDCRRFGQPVPLALLFGWLIINVSSNSHSVISLENKPLNYLGKISYGIYMYHMPVVYATSFLFKKYIFLTTTPVYFPMFFLTVFIFTITIASLSYFYIEQPILKGTIKPAKQTA